MASERQIAANRRNAKKSKGPKSRSGKKRSSKNPFRHGLSVPMSGVGSETQLKDLSRQFAGEASDAEILAEAARAAHAQLDLTRIRSVHTAMLKRALTLTAFAAEPFHPDLEEPGLRGAQADWAAAKRRQRPPHPKMLYPSITLPGGKDEERWVRVPTKPAMHSNLKPAGYSDRKPATLGVNRMGRFDDVVEG